MIGYDEQPVVVVVVVVVIVVVCFLTYHLRDQFENWVWTCELYVVFLPDPKSLLKLTINIFSIV